ncbi:DUF3862 domain-containing protein [Orenia marismortui]|uniref:Uncharacterized protein DUF3862 n=1 Tax=Orenia marismortui TaxID=46469 RepID=A0A4R8GTY4_9FIRM|nr:DUF3862 domain-containing protein [Orenia marismortui]TDX48314.1 uncharacterized protein DUF3862 [Orenia marismortui]
MNKTVLILVLILSLALVGCGATSKYTLEQFNQIKNGMSYDKVVEIVGDGGELSSETEMMGTKTSIYTWQNTSGSNMMITFQNGKVVSKAQAMLK